MKIKEIRDLSNAELLTRKNELRKDSFNLRISQQTGQLEKPSQIRANRKIVAQIETVLSERK